MDHWDPALINPLARTRPVILLDNTGVGKSGGEVPLTFKGWAENVILLLRALEVKQVDLLGFSIGGAAAQMVALNAPDIVHKLILAGTSASQNPSTVAGRNAIFNEFASATTQTEVELAFMHSFYLGTDVGEMIAKDSWERIHERKADRSNILGAEGTQRQIQAWQQWSTSDPSNSFDRLRELQIPIFVADGDHDVIIPSPNSWELSRHLENAHLHIYPLANHGFLNQYAELFTTHIVQFLDN